MPESRRQRILLLLCPPVFLVVCGMVVALVTSGRTAGVRGAAPVKSSQPAGVVVLEVDGEVISQEDLARAIPDNLLGVSRQRAEKLRLYQLVRNAIFRRFLRANNISVPEEKVDIELARVRSNPASSGCPLCIPADNFSDFLRQNFYTVEDVKDEIRSRLGLAIYLDGWWEREGKNTGREKRELVDERLQSMLMSVQVRTNAIMREWEEKRRTGGTSPAPR